LPEAVRPAGRTAVVAFANDWWTDPTSKHHLMRLMAERTDVLWVETSGMRRPSVGSAADWRRAWAKLRRMFGAVRHGAPNLMVLTAPSLPLPTSGLARAVNARLYATSIRRALRAMGTRPTPLLWVYTPTAARYLDRFPSARLVYHCVDRWWAFDNYDAGEMRACHEILCRRADHVFASSRELERDCRAFTDRVTYVSHGVDWAHFRRALTPVQPIERALVPRRPVAAFVGLIESWVDVELIGQVAQQHPEADVVVVGAAHVPVDTLQALPNVKLLGRQPFASLPDILRHVDVGLIPFHVNDLTLAVNPIKLREYLSAGVPVVSTALPELQPLAGMEGVDIAADRQAFLRAVAERLRMPADDATRVRLSDSMRGDSWEGRLEQMLQQIKDPPS
jgi:glycosyltransferase involved in cell wall biosynthesis